MKINFYISTSLIIMEKNKLQMWVLVAAAIIIAIILFFVFGGKQMVNNQPTTEPESVQDIDTQDTGIAASAISYNDALIKYAGRRIELDKDCHGYPASISYKDNVGIMIDNRSSMTRTVKVGTTFTIKPWGFKIVVLPDVYLVSKTLLVDCDGSQNVATILIQE